jgi:muramoyltetrapeptide carboxypeptidase
LISAISASLPIFSRANSDVAANQNPRTQSKRTLQSLTRPPRLREGDAVALLNPGGWVSDEFVERSVRHAEALGLKPRLGKHIRARYGGYAGSIEQRLEDLHAAFLDRDIKAIWTARGGSGTSQILPFVDYAMIARNPKVLLGYSDTTAILNAIAHRSRLVTFHAPNAISTLSDYSKNHLQSLLFEAAGEREPYSMRSAFVNDERAATEPEYQVRTHREGVAEGYLLGGNLAVFSAMIGTPFLPSLAGRLLFFEDINEAPYRIDRMLTQVRQHATRNPPAGTLFGVCRKCEATDSEPSLALTQVYDDHVRAQPIPTASGYSFGHIANQMTLPIGVRARLDTAEQTLTLLEAAVAK